MSKKNKIYWGLGVTERGTRALLTDENSKFKWLRSQRNRRILVVLYALGILVVSLGSYYPTLKTNLKISSETEITILVVTGIWVLLSLLIGYSLLRVAVRGIAEAPDELLDERQIQIRNSSYRYAYLALGWIVFVVFLLLLIGPELQFFQPEGNDGSYLMIATLFAFSALPSMIMAWRERDI
jgi:polyferredoxin